MQVVIHTVAHLMNVINFSKNYDPILSDLNMAEYKGQNPLELLVSSKYIYNQTKLDHSVWYLIFGVEYSWTC